MPRPTRISTATGNFSAEAGNGALKGYTGKVLVTSGIVTADNDDLSGLVHMIGPDATNRLNARAIRPQSPLKTAFCN